MTRMLPSLQSPSAMALTAKSKRMRGESPKTVAKRSETVRNPGASSFSAAASASRLARAYAVRGRVREPSSSTPPAAPYTEQLEARTYLPAPISRASLAVRARPRWFIWSVFAGSSWPAGSLDMDAMSTTACTPRSRRLSKLRESALISLRRGFFDTDARDPAPKKNLSSTLTSWPARRRWRTSTEPT